MSVGGENVGPFPGYKKIPLSAPSTCGYCWKLSLFMASVPLRGQKVNLFSVPLAKLLYVNICCITSIITDSISLFVKKSIINTLRVFICKV